LYTALDYDICSISQHLANWRKISAQMSLVALLNLFSASSTGGEKTIYYFKA